MIITVKLTEQYIKGIQFMQSQSKTQDYPTITGDMFAGYDATNLLVPGTAYDHKDIKADPTKVPLYNLKAAGGTADFNSIHSEVNLDLYILKSKDSTIEMPEAMALGLVGTVEEVV